MKNFRDTPVKPFGQPDPLPERVLEESEILSTCMERLAVDMVRLDVLKGFSHLAEIFDDVWPDFRRRKNRREDHTNVQAGRLRATQDLQPRLRRRNPRLNEASEVAIHCCEGDLKPRLGAELREEIQVLRDKEGPGLKTDFHACW